MILMIDNYDSFTYNLVQYLGEIGQKVTVKRNDTVTADEVEKLAPERIVISPGPGGPNDAGVSLELIRRFSGKIPILGVCLGHQCIGQAFGGKIIRAKKLMHGKISPITHDGAGVFKDLPVPFEATRYHSLVIDPQSLPESLMVNARSDDGEIMGVHHRDFAVFGVQFHPESILTEPGKQLLRNFIEVS